ncbi:MAG: DUF4846 domain-containing protein [Niabella sp.]
MNKTIYMLTLFCFCLVACDPAPAPLSETDVMTNPVSETKVSDIALPAGYKHLPLPANNFGNYLRRIALKKDKTVYLYNGQQKANQRAQYAVLDISVGKKDLQQCADAVMRLRAEYFYENAAWSNIHFKAGDGTDIRFDKWLQGTRYYPVGNKLAASKQNISTKSQRQQFEQYLETVFSYCGTATLPLMTIPKPISQMQPGDIFLKPGAPGHTVIVMDMAVNSKGQKKYLLAQSYMPAQDIHILRNPHDNSPWYNLNEADVIETPEWTFYKNQLYGWM